MTENKALPLQLLGSSFFAGIFGAYLYNRYLSRVQMEANSTQRRRSGNNSNDFDYRSNSNIDPIAALFNQNEISIPVLNHLTRVYATLGGTTLAAIIGSLVQMQTRFSTSLASLLSLGFAFSLQLGKAHLWKLLAFGFFNGMSLGGLIQLALHLNARIVPLALTAATTVFGSFAAAATLSSRRSLLYLYGILGSALSVFTISTFAQLFFRSKSLFEFNLYGPLLMFMGYVAADSQLIIERADQGDKDYVTHAWLLFTDLSGIFGRILVILLRQAEENERKKKKKRGNRDEDSFYD